MSIGITTGVLLRASVAFSICLLIAKRVGVTMYCYLFITLLRSCTNVYVIRYGYFFLYGFLCTRVT